MVDNDKLYRMIALARFEKKNEDKALRINKSYEQDFVSYALIRNFLLTTIAYVLLLTVIAGVLGVTSGPLAKPGQYLGALFLVLAAAHGVTILILARMRSRQRDKVLQEEITSRTSEHFDAKPEAGTA